MTRRMTRRRTADGGTRPLRATATRRRPARVLFYAHGGLVEEREGLLPVLARQKFWELNQVYPVYFVW